MMWKEALIRILEEASDFCHQKPNRRHLGRGMYLPSFSNPSKDAVVALDPEIGEDPWKDFRKEFPEIAWAFVETVHLWEMAEKPKFLGAFPPSSLPDIQTRSVRKKDAEALFSEAADQIGAAVVVIILTNGERVVPPKDDPALARTLWLLTAPCQAELPGEKAVLKRKSF